MKNNAFVNFAKNQKVHLLGGSSLSSFYICYVLELRYSLFSFQEIQPQLRLFQK